MSSFDAFLLLDFSATLLKDMKINPQEIVEVGAVVMDATTSEARCEPFHNYIRPVHKVKLSPYCIKQTGISQVKVDHARTFRFVFQELMSWLQKQNLTGSKLITVVSKDHQLKYLLPEQCRLADCIVPQFAKCWISIKGEFEKLTDKKVTSFNEFEDMSQHFGIATASQTRNARTGLENMTALLQRLLTLAAEKAQTLSPTMGRAMQKVNFEGFPAIESDYFKPSGGDEDSDFDPTDALMDTSPSPALEKLLASQGSGGEGKNGDGGFMDQEVETFLVIDFEATCIKDALINPQEIIEIPVLKVDARTLEPIAEFHTFVRPVRRPMLSPYCVKLTKITQAQVDASPDFPVAFDNLRVWLRKENCLDETRALFVTCGDWDLRKMLPAQVKLTYGDTESLDPIFKRWVNIKKVFTTVTKIPIEKGFNDLRQMLKALGIKHKGHLHSGRDDVRNIAKVMKKMATWTVLQPTS